MIIIAMRDRKNYWEMNNEGDNHHKMIHEKLIVHLLIICSLCHSSLRDSFSPPLCLYVLLQLLYLPIKPQYKL